MMIPWAYIQQARVEIEKADAAVAKETDRETQRECVVSSGEMTMNT